jgi:chromate transporter
VDPTAFYTQLVPVANALPGPILVKIASGVGYMYGESLASPAIGWLMALAVAAVCVCVCCSLVILVMHVYDSATDSRFIYLLRQNILPVISGMLISTSLAMLNESGKVVMARGMSGGLGYGAMLIWIGLLMWITRKKPVNDLLLLAGSATVSLLALFPW